MSKLFAAIALFIFAATLEAGEIKKRPLDPSSVKKVKSMEIFKQCALLGKLIRHQVKDKESKLRDAIDAELNGMIRDADYDAINDRKPEIGMHVCALIAAVGRPDHNNTSHSASGTRIQAVYPDGMYVYIDNGIVTGWQE